MERATDKWCDCATVGGSPCGSFGRPKVRKSAALVQETDVKMPHTTLRESADKRWLGQL